MSMPTPTEREQLAKAFKALSSPNRLAMYLDLLAQEETSVAHCCLGDLIARLEIGAPPFSHHNKERASAVLMEVQREERCVPCPLNAPMRTRLAAFLSAPQ